MIYACALPFNVLAILMHFFVHKSDSLAFHVSRDEKDEAMQILDRLYSAESHHTRHQVWKQMRHHYKEANSSQEEAPGLLVSVCHKDYRMATLVGCSVAFFNTMSGINIINGFSKQIFQEIAAKGAVSSLSPTQQNYFVGVGGFLATLCSIPAVKLTSRRGNLIGFHLLMGFALGLVALFIDLAKPNAALASMCAFIFFFQCSNGTLLWIYCAEICTDAALGLCVFVLMGMLTI